WISSGQQEYHLRGGTANSPANIVWGKTLRLALEDLEENRRTVQQYNDYVRSELKQMKDIVINSPADASPYVLNFSCLSIPSEVMMNALSLRDYCVSAQSTCESGQNYSAVMEQMFRNHTRLKGIIRVSFSHHQCWEDIRGFIKDLKEIVEKYG
ncbi:MAG: aminotransferase class V-fold PLP-dependent enzyme, partial [Erysipelotrichaceae bacterium]|nr:aminotransferase class V-fold PLP-dependent enzyme [Erysipelotrichaceae bacterium]